MLNSPETLEKLRAHGRSNPYPSDWHPILDEIHQILGVSLVWTSLAKAKAKKGSSGVQMVYEDRTIFVSTRAVRYYLPEWHETAHAIVGRSRLEESNYGHETLAKEVSDQAEYDTQEVQFWLLRRFHPDPKRVRRCWRAFGYNDREIEEVALKGRTTLQALIPELPELFDGD